MFFPIKRTLQKNRGFGLVETLVALGIFIVVSISIYSGFVQLLKVLDVLKTKNMASNLANQQIEIIRSLPFESLVVPVTQSIEREGKIFTVATNITNVDDDFDGLASDDPSDSSPIDYKMVEVGVQCTNCAYQEAIVFNTIISQ